MIISGGESNPFLRNVEGLRWWYMKKGVHIQKYGFIMILFRIITIFCLEIKVLFVLETIDTLKDIYYFCEITNDASAATYDKNISIQ